MFYLLFHLLVFIIQFSFTTPYHVQLCFGLRIWSSPSYLVGRLLKFYHMDLRGEKITLFMTSHTIFYSILIFMPVTDLFIWCTSFCTWHNGNANLKRLARCFWRHWHADAEVSSVTNAGARWPRWKPSWTKEPSCANAATTSFVSASPAPSPELIRQT